MHASSSEGGSSSPAGDHGGDEASQAEHRGPVAPVLDVELEGVLQALFAIRQDLLEVHAERPNDRVHGAVDVLQGCTATLRVLLRLVRWRRAAEGERIESDGELVDQLTGPFAVVSPHGDVLYINAALSALIGWDASVIIETPFEDRPWIDAAERRAHYDEVLANGRAETVFALRRGDGSRGMLACTTTLLEGDERLLLLTAELVGGVVHDEA